MSVFSDVVALAKAGYTPEQVKEILKMSNENEKKEKEEPKEEPKGKEEPKEKEPETKVYTTGKSEPDYKALYESTKNELDKIRVDNTREDMSNKGESIEDVIENIKKAIS